MNFEKMPVYMKYATSVKKVIYRDYDMNMAYQKHMEARTPKLIDPPFKIDMEYLNKKELIDPPFKIDMDYLKKR